jgi:hypothetical protein
MRIARRAVFVAVLLALLPTAAGAAFVQATDPNDVPGKLDLELVKGVRTASGQPITFTVRVQAIPEDRPRTSGQLGEGVPERRR